MKRGGFTLLEVLLAVAILVVVTAVTYLAFSTVAIAWNKGMKLSDGIHHADFVLDQLCMGLRSAYYPDAKSGEEYGFRLEDDGDGEGAADKISWVKLGYALVGRDCRFAGTPHRVEFTLDENEDGRIAASVRAWRILGQVDDFDPEEDVEPEFIATGMTGFNCRPMDPESRVEDQEIDWLDEWEDTNRVPKAVEITLYMEPLAEGEPPIEIRRMVTIPVAELSWRGWIPDEEDGTNTNQRSDGPDVDTRGGDSGEGAAGDRGADEGAAGANADAKTGANADVKSGGESDATSP